MNFDANVLQVAIEDIIPNRFQPRLAFEDNSLQELAESIKQHGIIQPLVLRRLGEKYEIIAGERRYKAAQIAGLTTVPAVISQLDDKTSAEVAVVENVQRKDLTAIEEAKSYKALLDQGYMSQDQLAKKMGLSQSAISNKLRLLTLPAEVQDAILENKISERHARSLIALKDEADQLNWLDKIIKERLTVRQLDEAIKKEYPTAVSVQSVDINEVKQKAVDIKKPEVSNPVVAAKPTGFAMGAIDLGERTQNKFFNTLEDEAANMQMTEAVNPFSQFVDEAADDNGMVSTTMINEAIKVDEKPVIEFPKEAETVLGGAISAEDLPKMKEENKEEESDTSSGGTSVFGPPPVANTPSIDTPIFEETPANLSEQVPIDNIEPVAETLESFSPVTEIPATLEPVKTVEPVQTPPTEEIETLDTLDFEPPKDAKKTEEAADRVQNLINELRIYGYPVESVKTDLVDQVTYTITIKKED